jgi:hypothetical protein
MDEAAHHQATLAVVVHRSVDEDAVDRRHRNGVAGRRLDSQAYHRVTDQVAMDTDPQTLVCSVVPLAKSNRLVLSSHSEAKSDRSPQTFACEPESRMHSTESASTCTSWSCMTMLPWRQSHHHCVDQQIGVAKARGGAASSSHGCHHVESDLHQRSHGVVKVHDRTADRHATAAAAAPTAHGQPSYR